MKMFKLLSLLFAATLIALLFSCSSGEQEKEEPAKQEVSQDEEKPEVTNDKIVDEVLELKKAVITKTNGEEFSEVDEIPQLDMTKLQKLIKYPEEALKSDIQGKVVVKALIDDTGQVREASIAYSDNELLNDAAVSSIMQYDSFTPAKVDGKPVKSWVYVPITFKLK